MTKEIKDTCRISLELIYLGDTSLHIINGKVAMALFNSRHIKKYKDVIPLKKDKIQIQYKNEKGRKYFYFENPTDKRMDSRGYFYC